MWENASLLAHSKKFIFNVRWMEEKLLQVLTTPVFEVGLILPRPEVRPKTPLSLGSKCTKKQ